MIWIIILLQNKILSNNVVARRNCMLLQYWMVLLLLHNAFNLNKVSSNFTSRISPNNYSTFIMLNSLHNAIFSFVWKEIVWQTLFIYLQNSSVHSTFFQSSKVQSLCCHAHFCLFNLFSFYRGFLTDTHPVSQTERSLLLTDIGCWLVELNSAVSWEQFFFCSFC